jgi:pimeloyl-ACP methyl ester carboxylesterase
LGFGALFRRALLTTQIERAVRATAVQNPLTSLRAGVEATRDVLSWQDGPTVLVAHSFGGMVLTEAGVDPRVSAVVYVAARAPDAGEDYAALASKYPTPPATAGIIWSNDYGRLSEGGVSARFRRRRACGESARPVRRSGTIQALLAGGSQRNWCRDVRPY